MGAQNSTIKILIKLLSDSRKELLNAGVIKKDEMGCCVYPDINNPGETLCGDNWSEAMCDYAGGEFHPGEVCDDQDTK
jgi:hypothetical protein